MAGRPVAYQNLIEKKTERVPVPLWPEEPDGSSRI